MTERVTILGCGYVGTALARYWQQRGTLEVTVTTTTPDRVKELEPIADRVVILDTQDIDALRDLVVSTSILVVSVASKRVQPYDVTYLGTARNLAKVLAELDHEAATSGDPTQFVGLKQVIYTSSCGVYGDRGGEWVSESAEVNPEGENQQILAQAEAVILGTATPTRKACVLRLGGIYGPDREISRIYKNVAGTIRPGDGLHPTNWIHRDDIVSAIDVARSNRLSGIFNVVDDDWMSNRELLDRVCALHHWEPVTWDASRPGRRSYNAKVSNQKIKAAGLSLRYPKRKL
jgi:nucleoside-diphosphate-sugar epimerase